MSTAESLYRTFSGFNKLLQDSTTLSWANGVAANTSRTIDFVPNAVLTAAGVQYAITVVNLSVAVSLTVKVRHLEKVWQSQDRYPELVGARFTVPANVPDGVTVLVTGWMLGDGARLELLNDSTSDNITAYVKVRRA